MNGYNLNPVLKKKKLRTIYIKEEKNKQTNQETYLPLNVYTNKNVIKTKPRHPAGKAQSCLCRRPVGRSVYDTKVLQEH